MNPIRPILYIRIQPDWLSVRLVGTDRRYADTPHLAVDNEKRTIVAIGREAVALVQAQGDKFSLRTAFAHPRMLIDDYDSAQAILKYAYAHVLNMFQRLILKPVALVQPVVRLEGGLAQIEKQALMDVVVDAGAHRAVLLSDDECELPDEALMQLSMEQRHR